jgi:hypothetical protein
VVVEAQTLTLGRITLRVQRDGRGFTVEVTPDGEGLVSHAGAALLAEAADRLGLTRALSAGLAGCVSAAAGLLDARTCQAAMSTLRATAAFAGLPSPAQRALTSP